MNELLDWAEKAGSENIRFRLQNSETLAKESATLLTVLLAGIGGSLAYAAKYFDVATKSAPFAAGFCALGVWLMCMAALLVHYCICTAPLQAPTNEPANLFQPEFTVAVLREVELENLQARINQTIERNFKVARWLDRVRYLAVVSPVIFIIAAVVVSEC